MALVDNGVQFNTLGVTTLPLPSIKVGILKPFDVLEEYYIKSSNSCPLPEKMTFLLMSTLKGKFDTLVVIAFHGVLDVLVATR